MLLGLATRLYLPASQIDPRLCVLQRTSRSRTETTASTMARRKRSVAISRFISSFAEVSDVTY